MFRPDRFTKLILVVIAVLLAALVARPHLGLPTQEAVAQSVSAINGDRLVLGYKTLKIGAVQWPAEISPKAIHIVDSAQSIVVEYNDGLVIYRIVEDSISTENLRNR